MADVDASKVADLAGPGIGSYEELEKVLPENYSSLLTPKETQMATFAMKEYIEKNLCKVSWMDWIVQLASTVLMRTEPLNAFVSVAQELNLIMTQVPLIVESSSGVNDLLDRDGSRDADWFPHQE